MKNPFKIPHLTFLPLINAALRHLGKYFGFALLLTAGGFLSACGGGGGPDASAPPKTPIAVQATSYLNAKNVGFGNAKISTIPGNNVSHAFADFKRNGEYQLFMATLVYDTSKPEAQATKGQFKFYTKNADGSYTEDGTLLADKTGCIHPRKAIVADFNQDGRPDVFVACHGYDAQLFPGEKSAVLLSQADGTYKTTWMADKAFNHAAAAGDLNGDGYPDVVLVDNTVAQTPYVLINNKDGSFTKSTEWIPPGLKFSNTFSVELVDFNNDGKLDLWIAGHEWETQGSPRIYLNPGNGNFSAVTPTILPAVEKEGVVLDMVFHNNHIYMLRTSGGDGTFYKSIVVQKVSYPGLQSSVIYNNNRVPIAMYWDWMPWMLVVDGKLISTSDIYSSFSVTP